MRFEYPWLIPLIIIPLILLIFRSKTTARAAHPMVAILKDFESRWVMRLFRVLAVLVIIGLAVAISRPVIDGGTELLLTRTRDTCILIDKSGSMGGVYKDADESDVSRWKARRGADEDSDLRLTKYGLSRQLALRFMELRNGDRITVFIFNDKPYALWPLTQDHEIFKEWLMMPDKAEGGTDIDVAMIACLEHLEELGQTGERTIILASDGEDYSWRADMETQIEKQLKKTNTKFFWIYVENPHTIKSRRDDNRWDPSQKALFKFARMTGGKVFDAGSEKALSGAFEAIAKLQTYPVFVRLPVPKADLYPYALGFTLACAFLAYVFERIWRR